MVRSVFLLWLLMLAPAWGQAAQFNAVVRLQGGMLNIGGDGQSLRFRDIVTDLNRDQWVEAEICPAFDIVDASGMGRGWQVVVSAQDLTSAGGHVIPARNLHFSGTGSRAQLWKITGDHPHPAGGPMEVDGRVPLAQAQVLNCRSGYGRGRYRWAPRPQQFLLNIPADTAPGRYQGQITFTVLSRP